MTRRHVVAQEAVMHRARRRLGLAGALVVLVSGCGSAATLDLEQADLAAMEEYGCGFGFWLSSDDEELAVRFSADDASVVDGDLPQRVTLPDEAWNATVLVGEDLYANWCDDVLEPGEPEPQVREEWPITAGRITVDDPVPGASCPEEAHATVSDLEATRPDGTTVELGGREVSNDTWGCFAG